MHFNVSIDDIKYDPNSSSLLEELDCIIEYRKSWLSAPYPPTFVTVDAVVIQDDHILLIRRGRCPGKGLWALPGGFLDQDETIEEGVLRELREETQICVSDQVLRDSIKGSKVFDDPNRSLRGRTISHAFIVALEPGEFPKVDGSDDAMDAKWFHIDDVRTMEPVLFDDHYSIIMWAITSYNL